MLALEGSFTQLVQTPGGFSRATDLGADVRYWDASATPPREGVARIYAAGERARAFVSEAELDAMDRMLEGRPSGGRLEAPWLCGAVARMSRESGLDAPVNRAVYAALKPYVGGSQAQAR